MANSIDDAIARILEFAAAVTVPNATIKAESAYPTEAAQPFPFCVVFLSNGTFHGTNKTIHHNFPVLAVEFHFSRTNLSQAYAQINAVAVEFPQRIVADPTLEGVIETVVMGRENPIPYRAEPFKYGNIDSQMLRFDIPIKLLKAPQATA